MKYVYPIITILLVALISQGGILDAQSDQTFIAYVSQNDSNDDIFLTNLSNTTTYNLTDARSRDWHPTWSSNGTQLAFNSDRTGNPDIFIMDANGANPINITNDPAVDVSPDWSPIRNEIAFISDRDGGFDLYIYQIDTAMVVRLTVDGNAKSDPNWSPNGLEIVYWELVGDSIAQLMTINVQTGETQVLIDSGQNLWGAWSPDGNTILFHSGVTGDDNIFSYNLADAEINNLVDEPSNDKQADWSPDGEQIVFVSDRNGTQNLYLISADGEGVEQLTNSPSNVHSPAWQPLPADIDFSNTSLGQNINVVQGDINGEQQRELGVGEARLFAPETANVDDVIRVRFELEVESQDSDATPVPTPDIPLRGTRALEIYQYMGARLVGFDLDRFEIYPEDTGYLLEIQEDGLNYWEWYLRPVDTSATGRRFLAVEIYLPQVENDGTVIETVIDRLTFEVDITEGQPEIESEYIQEDILPEPPISVSMIFSDETSLSIVFHEDTDISEMRISSALGDYAIPSDFTIFNETGQLVPEGTCLFYELANAELVLPRACRTDTAFNLLLSAADIFWFDDRENRLLDVIINYQDRAYPCNARFSICDFRGEEE